MEFFAKIVKSYNYFVLCDEYSEPCLLSNIQMYSGIFTSYSEIFRHFVAYLELLHIQIPVIFRILAYLEPKIYSELCQGILWHIQNAL